MSDAPLLDRVLEVVRSHQPFAREKGLRLVGVVGSVARGESRPDSDIDVVYDVVGQPSYFDVAAVAAALEDALDRRVDMVGRRAIRPDRWAFMGRDLVTV
ncbi:nucleotidyltransferase family protein [Brevundimonas balnearis]|uniref:Nucleotidyltransferase family protein n=1 Tax=Brevundimonas balnearis TaxID=1572858 RepID=A0ABV6R2S9_9CAUL